MSSAETTHPIGWRDAPKPSRIVFARLGRKSVGEIWPCGLSDGQWSAKVWPQPTEVANFSTASAARSFVEKSVKEAGQ